MSVRRATAKCLFADRRLLLTTSTLLTRSRSALLMLNDFNPSWYHLNIVSSLTIGQRKVIVHKPMPPKDPIPRNKIPLPAAPPVSNLFGSRTVDASAQLNIDVNNLSKHIVSVSDVPTAQSVLKIMESYPDAIWACDTEVAEIDVKSQSPVGNGIVTCVSIYGGPDIDFGNGPGGILWIEAIDGAQNVLPVFKSWFENPNYKKVWHNYGKLGECNNNAQIDISLPS